MNTTTHTIMNRTMTITLAALLLMATGVTHGALVILEDSFEVDLTQVTLPVYPGTSVVVRLCSDCNKVVLEIDRRTTYYIGVGSKAITPEEFHAALDAIQDPRNGLVYVMYRPDSRVVTRIMLSQ